MKQLLSIAAAALVAVLSGCTTTYRDAGANYLDRPENSSNPMYYTEYNVSPERVSADGASSVLFWFFQFSEGKHCLLQINPNLSFIDKLIETFSPSQKAVINAKSAALYNACEASGADQILGATFEYTITDYLFFSEVSCVVKGFPAIAKSVKMVTKRPVVLNRWQKLEYIAPYENPMVLDKKAPAAKLSLDKWLEK